jgi:hypothetical protein
MKTRLLAILNLITLGFQLLMSYLVQTKLFSNQDVGQVSAKYDTVFAPAGITFAIWGLIYTSLLAFCVFHLYKALAKTSSCQDQSGYTEYRLAFCAEQCRHRPMVDCLGK